MIKSIFPTNNKKKLKTEEYFTLSSATPCICQINKML